MTVHVPGTYAYDCVISRSPVNACKSHCPRRRSHDVDPYSAPGRERDSSGSAPHARVFIVCEALRAASLDAHSSISAATRLRETLRRTDGLRRRHGDRVGQ